ncbi:uncharacterized protein LOC130725491 [Lotus japonicus]|uniref:uncharacterized protein LOC130725491 n=1 Tax=Lotus japonicus TaxID=34305 RepID=UPI002588823B|nr:uncharacterized protein LOC130725491 [Lotus japonicus]
MMRHFSEMKGRERWREKGKEKEQRLTGWITQGAKGGRATGISGRRRSEPQPSGGDITSYYFSNFPENFTEKNMWEIFQRYDRVWEVFIAPRRDKKGKRFGFVRFINVKNPARLERDLDTIIIGCTKMHVNFPRFYKPSDRERPPLPRQPEPVQRKVPRIETIPHVTAKTKTAPQLNNMRRSFVEVVTSEPGTCREDMRVDHDGKSPTSYSVEVWKGPVNQVVPDWLSRSVVGVVRDLELIPHLQNAAMLEGFHYIQVRYMGDDSVLLTGPEGFDLEDALKGVADGPDAVFDVVYPWSPKDAPDHRVSWVRCTGLPLHMWNKACFTEAVKPIGDLISVDTSTSDFTFLEYARILVRTNIPHQVSHYRRVNVQGTVYNIRLMEEFCESPAHKCGINQEYLDEDEDDVDEDGQSSPDWSVHVVAQHIASLEIWLMKMTSVPCLKPRFRCLARRR